MKEFIEIKADNLVLDVRPELEFEMCNIPGTINFPYSKIEKKEKCDFLNKLFNENLSKHKTGIVIFGMSSSIYYLIYIVVYLLCRRGNDSQRAVGLLQEWFSELPVTFLNVTGGLYAYSKYIDSNFPLY